LKWINSVIVMLFAKEHLSKLDKLQKYTTIVTYMCLLGLHGKT